MAKHATRLYWIFRLDFLSGSMVFFIVRQRMHNHGIFQGLAAQIDEIEDVNYRDDTPWSKEPYDKVITKNHYDEPKRWFSHDFSREIISTHLLHADLYWTKQGKYSFSTLKYHQMMVIVKWAIRCLVYLVLILLGTVTAGFFWPKNFRKGFLSLGIKAVYDKLEAEDKADDAATKKKEITS